MNHIYEYREDGSHCVLCGKHEPHAFDYPEVCPCGKPWVKESLELPGGQDVNQSPRLEKECEGGDIYYYYSSPASRNDDCPKGKVLEDFFYLIKLLPTDHWRISGGEQWQQFGDQVSALIQKALKVDALFPEGLQHLAERLSVLREE